MPEPRKLSAYFVNNTKPAPSGKRDFYWDADVPGLALRVTDTGHRSWVVQRRLAGEMKRWTLAPYIPAAKDDPDLEGTLAWARERARSMLGDIARGVDPAIQQRREQREAARQQAGTLRTVVGQFITRYAKKHNRSWAETERIFERYVMSQWGDRSIFDISRLDVTELLDGIEENNGPVMADRTLAAVRKLFNWYATRDDKFASPVVRGMARTKPKDRARERTLDDAEIRALWTALDKSPRPFAGIVRALLFTAQRRDEVAGMERHEIARDAQAWTIPAKRYKTKRDHVVPLTQAVREIIDAQPHLKIRYDAGKLVESCYVFSTHGKAPFSGFTKAKTALDKAMLDELQKLTQAAGQDEAKVKLVPWTLHDLRRTAKTLMTRNGVPHFHADRVLGHVIPGVGGTYDRHDYLNEKRKALEALAVEVARILEVRSTGSSPVGQRHE